MNLSQFSTRKSAMSKALESWLLGWQIQKGTSLGMDFGLEQALSKKTLAALVRRCAAVIPM